jgi:hypothetical protein
MAYQARASYDQSMTITSPTTTNVMPSATIDEAELAAWSALSRDEQVRRYREVLLHPDCNKVTDDSLGHILAAARQRVAALRRG